MATTNHNSTKPPETQQVRTPLRPPRFNDIPAETERAVIEDPFQVPQHTENNVYWENVGYVGETEDYQPKGH